MKIVVVTQARFSSTRLPGKVLLDLAGKKVLQLQLERLRPSKTAQHFMVATTHEPKAQGIIDLATQCGWDSYRGDLDDVLERFYHAAGQYSPDVVIRVTSDCPLVDVALLDAMVADFLTRDCDYLSNIHPPTYPDGQDIEVFTWKALEQARKEASLLSEREHVTPYIWKRPEVFRQRNFVGEKDYSSVRMTLDTPKDLMVIHRLVSDLGASSSWEEYAEHFIRQNLQSLGLEARNAGYASSLVKEHRP